MSFEVGQSVTAQTIATNLAGTPVNTPTVVVTVTDPAGMITTPAVTNTAAGGIYTAVVPAALPGTYLLRWVASGTVVGAHEDQFSVRPQGARLISLADGKRQLGIQTTDQDLELADFIDALTSDVENVVGPIVPRTCVRVIEIAGPEFVLPDVPAISLTSVVPQWAGWGTVSIANLILDGTTGKVYPTPGTWIYGRYVVTYQAGRTIIPAGLTAAALDLLQHQWATQRNRSAGRPPVFGDDVQVQGMSYLIPYRVAEKLVPYQSAAFVA